MRHLAVTLFLAAAVAPWLGACSADGVQPTQPKLASEAECLAATNRYRCKFQHDLAGGYPFTLDRSGR